MALSNGYDETKVLAALRGRIGWRVPDGPGFQPIDADLKASESGRYFNSFHASVTLQNVLSNQPEAGISNAGFNAYLKSLKDEVISNMLETVFTQPQAIDAPAYLFQPVPTESPSGVPDRGEFVGYRLKVAPGNYGMQVHGGQLFFDQDTNVTLYAYAEFKKEPVFGEPVNGLAGDLTDFSLPNWVFTPGVYFIGYFQTDAAGSRPINMDDCWNRFSIIGSTSVSIPVVSPLEIKYTKHECTSYNYGLNLEVSTYRDFTKDILRNKHLFDELIGLQMAIQVLDLINFATRSNENERILKDSISQMRTDLNRDEPTEAVPFSPGLRSKLRREIAKVHATFWPKKKITTTQPTVKNAFPKNVSRRY